MKGDTFRRHVRDGKTNEGRRCGGTLSALAAHTRASCTHLGLVPRFSLLRGEERGKRGPGGNGHGHGGDDEVVDPSPHALTGLAARRPHLPFPIHSSDLLQDRV